MAWPIAFFVFTKLLMRGRGLLVMCFSCCSQMTSPIFSRTLALGGATTAAGSALCEQVKRTLLKYNTDERELSVLLVITSNLQSSAKDTFVKLNTSAIP